MVRLTRTIDFCASLRYARADLSEAENRRCFGPEAAQHGHNYRLEVTVRGEPDPLTGMVMNITELKDVLEREVEARFDHRDLNADTPYFEKHPPTPENLACTLANILREALPAGSFDRLRLHQDAELYVDVIEDPA